MQQKKRMTVKAGAPRATLAAAVAAVALLLVGIALAANPKPGATYKGKVPERLIYAPGSSQPAGRYPIKFTVSDNGRQVTTYRARYVINCGGVVISTTDSSIPINNGAFADQGSYSDGAFTDHVKLTGDFIKHGKAAKVTFRWNSTNNGCATVSMKGTVHVA